MHYNGAVIFVKSSDGDVLGTTDNIDITALYIFTRAILNSCLQNVNLNKLTT